MVRKIDVQAWLRQGPSLEELQAAYPEEWAAVRGDITDLVSRGDLDQLKAYVAAVSALPTPTRTCGAGHAATKTQSAPRCAGT